MPDGAELWHSVEKYARQPPLGVPVTMGRLREFADAVSWPSTERTKKCIECDGTGRWAKGIKCDDCEGHGKVVPYEPPVCARVGAAVVNRLLFARALACIVATDDETVHVHVAHDLDPVEIYGDGFRAFVMPMRAEGFEIAATLDELVPPKTPTRRGRVSP